MNCSGSICGVQRRGRRPLRWGDFVILFAVRCHAHRWLSSKSGVRVVGESSLLVIGGGAADHNGAWWGNGAFTHTHWINLELGLDHTQCPKGKLSGETSG